VPAADMLGDLLLGYLTPSAFPRARCATVAGGPGLHFNLSELSAAVSLLGPTECIAYSVRLDVPLPMRLVTIAVLSYRLRQVERIFERGHVSVVGSFGIDPHLDAPSFVYELNSAAADYADRCLRPRGKGEQLRRFVTYFCGYDLALGGVVVIGRKNQC
jgi:hypothetical protein